MIDMLNLMPKANEYHGCNIAANGVFVSSWVIVALLLLLLLIAVLGWLFHLEAKNEILYEQLTDELQVGKTREEVIAIMTNHAFMGNIVKDYSTDSDGTMYFITKKSVFRDEQERVVVKFDKDNKVKSWHIMPF